MPYEPVAAAAVKVFRQGDPTDIAGYEVASEEFQDVQRDRTVVRIQINEATDEQTGAAIADALRFALDDYPGAVVAKVFAYSFGDDPTSVYTRGLGELSRDGKGWTGNGRTALDDSVSDQLGIAFVIVDSVYTDEPAARFKFADPTNAASAGGSGNSSAVDALLAAGSGGSKSADEEPDAGKKVVQDGWQFQFVAAERDSEFVEAHIGFENLTGGEADAPITNVVLTDGNARFRPVGLIGPDGQPTTGFGAALAIPRFQSGDVLTLELLYRIPPDVDVASLTIAE